jgi:signal transduction histidine kinase
MSRQIVEKNNGTIEVANTSDGAKFIIKLNKE